MDDRKQLWKPAEIIIHQRVTNDPITRYFLSQCPGVPVQYVASGKPTDIVRTSRVLSQAKSSMLDEILLGKDVVYIGPATDVVDTFTMDDDRMMCPHFDRLKLASNGCFYRCDCCYLKGTYRNLHPFITVRVEYEKIKNRIRKMLSESKSPILLNSGELADSLSMEHLTRAGREFIPWFGNTENGYLFMLTKSDNVDDILNLPHNGHTVIAWSLNNEEVSRKFEIGAPPFERRLKAAQKVQGAGYRLRIRLDPIVPIQAWQEKYSETIKRIFESISPEGVTLGTLRFEEEFYNIRHNLLRSDELINYLDDMKPMFPPKLFPGKKRPKSGKFSFKEAIRTQIFTFVIAEIRKHSNCPIALCKESATVWNSVNLPLSNCQCVCQLNPVDMTAKMV